MIKQKWSFAFLPAPHRPESSPISAAKPGMLNDCGVVSQKTQGWPNQIFYEHGFPPFNTVWFSE